MSHGGTSVCGASVVLAQSSSYLLENETCKGSVETGLHAPLPPGPASVNRKGLASAQNVTAPPTSAREVQSAGAGDAVFGIHRERIIEHKFKSRKGVDGPGATTSRTGKCSRVSTTPFANNDYDAGQMYGVGGLVAGGIWLSIAGAWQAWPVHMCVAGASRIGWGTGTKTGAAPSRAMPSEKV